VTDFKSGTDKIDVSVYGFADGAAVLAATSNQGSDAVIDLSGASSVA
jgi:hypothetical protein